jgi:hypothetical protein
MLKNNSGVGEEKKAVDCQCHSPEDNPELGRCLWGIARMTCPTQAPVVIFGLTFSFCYI